MKTSVSIDIQTVGQSREEAHSKLICEIKRALKDIQQSASCEIESLEFFGESLEYSRALEKLGAQAAMRAHFNASVDDAVDLLFKQPIYHTTK